ncbi:MAG: hypothetical protein KAG61_11465 [Bacteriovoracaceae bacterium]|nr:hypothetical protein [Bacteriovoracaceae bacterium]
MKNKAKILLPIFLLITLISSIFAAQSLRTLQKRTNIRVNAGKTGLAKIVTLPKGTVVSFSQDDLKNAKNLEYTPGRKTEFVENIKVVSIPAEHGMLPHQIDELAYNLDTGIPLYMSKDSLESAKSPGSQQDFVMTLKEGAMIYSHAESFNILNKEELGAIRNEVLFSEGSCTTSTLPSILGTLHFSPVGERIYGDMVMNYSLSPQVDKMLSYALNRKKAPGAQLGDCYRYVKLALLNANLVPFYLDGGSAYMATDILTNVEKRLTELKKRGEVKKSAEVKNYVNLIGDDSPYKDLIKNPYDAPRGSILIYEGGLHGHIEIKVGNTGEGGFISDYFSDSARTGDPDNGLTNQLSGSRTRKLVAVLVRPGME